jgi:hypothetical protein
MWILIFLFIVLIGAGIFWYLQQQKEEEVVVTAEPTVVTETTPSGPDVDIYDGGIPKTPRNNQWNGDAANRWTPSGWVNSQGAAIEWFQAEKNLPVWAQWYLVGSGQAKSWKDCQEAARREGHKTWGYRKGDRSCFAYYDNNYLMRMRTPGTITKIADHTVGCTEPGRMLSEGCEDWSKGDRVRGTGGSGNRVPLEPNHQGISIDQCIAKGKAKGIDAIFYHTQGHSDRRYAATCYEIKDPDNLVGFTGNKEDWHHVQACTDPSKKVINGCQ